MNSSITGSDGTVCSLPSLPGGHELRAQGAVLFVAETESECGFGFGQLSSEVNGVTQLAQQAKAHRRVAQRSSGRSLNSMKQAAVLVVVLEQDDLPLAIDLDQEESESIVGPG